jgi:dCMP deaminase
MKVWTKWDERFLNLAMHVSLWSRDPSTKVGTVIVDPLRRVIGFGYNGFPRGVHDSDNRYNTRELKYEMVVHAEINAVLNAVKDVRGCTLYSTFFPCPRCAAVLIQAGIGRVVSWSSPSDGRYADMRRIAEQMFREAGVIHD